MTDFSIVNLLSVYLLIRTIFSYYPNYPTHRLYFGEFETPYRGPAITVVIRDVSLKTLATIMPQCTHLEICF